MIIITNIFDQKCIIVKKLKNGKVDADFDTDLFMEMSIIKIHNLKTKSGKNIESGSDLLDAGGLADLCAEVLTGMQATSAIDKKK